MLIGLDNHTFVFLSAFSNALRSMMNNAPRYIPLCKLLVNVLAPLLSLARDVLSLLKVMRNVCKLETQHPE